MLDNDILSTTAWAVSGLSALNWGVEEAFSTNLITDTLGLGPEAAGIAYLGIGVAGVLNLIHLGQEVL